MKFLDKDDDVEKDTKLSDTGSNFVGVKDSDDELFDIVDVEPECSHGEPLENGMEYTEWVSEAFEASKLLGVFLGNGSSYIGSDISRSSNKFWW